MSFLGDWRGERHKFGFVMMHSLSPVVCVPVTKGIFEFELL